ncbi:MAG TPA: hypothetical protein VLI07_18810 [Candidatus Binatus sp.]|nr:hypothetical protein [Candidatus Binatus sp.]
MSDLLPLEDCLAWVERYRSTPWGDLALATAADHQPSPLRVLGSLAQHAARVVALEAELHLAREMLRELAAASDERVGALEAENRDLRKLLDEVALDRAALAGKLAAVAAANSEETP